MLASIGLTVSDAFRLMMMRLPKEKALPFEPLVPNKETVAEVGYAAAVRISNTVTHPMPRA